MIGVWFGHFKILGLRYLSDFQVEPITVDGCTNLDCKAEVRISYTEFHSFFFFHSSFFSFFLSSFRPSHPQFWASYDQMFCLIMGFLEGVGEVRLVDLWMVFG